MVKNLIWVLKSTKKNMKCFGKNRFEFKENAIKICHNDVTIDSFLCREMIKHYNLDTYKKTTCNVTNIIGRKEKNGV